MEITEVRIKLMEDPQERLQAFCSICRRSSVTPRKLQHGAYQEAHSFLVSEGIAE